MAQFVVYQDSASQWRWSLFSGSNIIAVCGEGFVREDWVYQSIANMRRYVPGATVVKR